MAMALQATAATLPLSTPASKQQSIPARQFILSFSPLAPPGPLLLRPLLLSAPSPALHRAPLSAHALAEDEAPAAEESIEEKEQTGTAPGDELLLYFKAEGSLAEGAIPRAIKALEGLEGVDNVRITVLESCATAECTRTTTVQAAAASSSIVEALQGAGFGLQTVSLGFNDDGTETAAELFKVYTEEGVDVFAGAQAE